MTVHLSLFGSPAVVHGGRSIALPFERRGQLLAVLALKRAWVGRAELAALLWPEQETKLAYTNLRKALHRLQSLPWAPALELQGSAVRFDADTDVAAFEAALREERIAEALALRSGELLTGFDDDANDAWSGWLHFERDRLRAAWRGAALSRLDSELDAAEAIDLSARLLEADPLDEAALRAHMTWLAQAGQSARARQAYREFVDRVQKDLGLAPSAELSVLHDALGSPATTIRAAPLPPAADAGFIGRAAEMRRIAALLAQDDCRLLCLIGPGGIGKTRLARRVLRELAPGYAGGTAFIALEDVTSSEEIGTRLAHDLGVALAGKAAPLDQVIEFLRERESLLVLDNFEQLAAHAALLERLLASCPRLKIIVTSRVRLATASEWMLPLEGLPCPEPEDGDRIEAFDAARLFLQAARRVQPALDPAAEAAAIVDICRQLEGMPLALEFAAAWTRVLPCAAIADELRRGVELLQTDDLARPARHASIEAVFDQSLRLLSHVERESLARLSVFRGGFTAEAARAIAGASPPVLGALADKSLLRKEGDRLQLHPLVQQLAAARLGEGPARLAAQTAHARYFHNLLAQLKAASEDGERRALQWIDAEFDNCRAAWQFSIAQSDAAALSHSVLTLINHFDHRARFEEALGLLRQALDAPLGRADAGFNALLLSQASFLEFRLARFGEAESTATLALAAARRKHDRETKFRAMSVLASCAVNTGRLPAARRHYTQALALAEASAALHDTAATLENLALVEKRMGLFDDALRRSIEALAQHRRIGDSASVALNLSNLGSFYMFLNNLEAGEVHLREALAIAERDGLVSTRAFVLANLTELALKRKDDDAARRHAERALEVARASGIRALAGWLEVQLARLAARRGETEAARAMLAAGAALALTLNAPSLKAAGLLGFAELLEAQGHGDVARRVLAFAMEQPSLSVPDREELRAEWARRSAGVGAGAPWPAMALDELMHRIVAESEVAHAPLIALLRRAP